MRFVKYIILCCCLLFSISLISQQYDLSSESKKAVKFYKKAEEAYIAHDAENTIRHLLKAVENDTSFIEAWLLLGDVYYDERDYAKAEEAYANALEVDPDFFPRAFILLGEVQIEQDKYHEAAVNLSRFLEYPGYNEEMRNRVKIELQYSRFRARAYENPVPFNPVNLGDSINTDADEYMNAISTDQEDLIFTRRTLLKETPDTRKYKENILRSEKKNDVWGKAKELDKKLESLGNIGAMTISPDGNYLFFTVCNSLHGYGSCDLFYALRKGEGWGLPVNLGPVVNSGAWDSQPAFSSDGRTLYFTSTRPGGKGSSDIWKSTIQENGKWSEPVNLGYPVNTSKEEMAPFIHPDDHSLYFSSKGHVGMGGSDLFLSRRSPEGYWLKPLNLGYPINTEADEINIIVNPDAENAYISSDLEGGYGKFDIYEFALHDSIKPAPVTYLKGKVYDAVTLEPLNAKFELIRLKDDKKRVEAFSDEKTGEFLVVIPVGEDFALNVSKKAYLFYSDNFALAEIKDKTDPYLKDIPLQPIEIGSSVVLKNIFFDTDKYDLKQESISELTKLIDFLKNNPDTRIEIGGHTDNVGTAAYNQVLSENRARAVFEYLVSNGIEKDRLQYQGYGLTQAVAGNETEKGRAENRRTEFRIISK